ncbi:hypothetical protein [Vibrio astriarenae]|uniref:hypothetical protein n=1 Tax=Vibrio astriarenae TaxID=1481923 RepID=UPI003736A09D
MNHLKTIFKTVALACLIFVQSTSLLATECAGNWTITLDTLAVEYRDDKAGYIPAYINLSRDIRYCRNPYIYLSLDDRKMGTLFSPRANLSTEFVDRNGRHLNYVNNQGYRLKLENSARTKFWLKVNGAKTAPSATYVGNINATLGLDDKSDEKTALVNHFIPPFVFFTLDKVKSKSVRGSGDHYSMDLGTLNKGDQHYAYFYLLSNANIDVTVERDKGALYHDKKRDLKIDYQLNFDGHNVDKRLAYTINNQRMLMLEHIPMKLTVGNTDFAYAGTYRDVVRIEVKAKY